MLTLFLFELMACVPVNSYGHVGTWPQFSTQLNFLIGLPWHQNDVVKIVDGSLLQC